MSFVSNFIGKLKSLQGNSSLTPPQVKASSSNGFTEVVEEPPNSLSPEESITFIQAFPFWYHRIYLGHGIYTVAHGPAHHEGVWQRLKPAFPTDLQGVSVLDVGSNAGYFSMQVKRIGAGKVVGLEPGADYLRQAEVCRQIWNLDIEYRDVDAEQVGTIEEKFDLVIFAGILYHLKNPIQALEAVGRICQDAVIVETEIIAEDPRNCVYVNQGLYGQVQMTMCRTGIMKFLETHELNSDPTNWWIPDTECVFGMLRTAGFKYFSAPYYLSKSRLLLIASKKSNSLLDLQALK